MTLRKTVAHCDFEDHGCFNLSIKCAKIITQANIGPVLFLACIWLGLELLMNSKSLRKIINVVDIVIKLTSEGCVEFKLRPLKVREP